MSFNNVGLGATYSPGGSEDYYLPAQSPQLVSPAPQRITQEDVDHIQEHVAHLELEANDRQGSVPPHAVNDNAYPARFSSIAGNTSQAQWKMAHDYSRFGGPPADEPTFSPFPKLQNPPPNVPPSDDEKEAILENARIAVLNSNDPEMQLAWAQDALAYVDAAQIHEERLRESQPARPTTPAVEHQLRVDAMNIVSFLAEQHHPRAEFMRGMWLEFGKFGNRVDKKEAFRCYARSADKCYWRAEYRLGMLFEGSNDAAKALMHYQRGVDAGDSASNYRLGMMTLLGQNGQLQDFNRGLQLIKLAAQTADENAPQGAYVLGMLQASELPQIQIPSTILPYDEKAAKMNIEKAAYLGFAKAQLKMGSAYELCTLGCDFNPALSLHYNALAARQGEPEADMAISKWFLCGYEGVFPKNEELAYTYAQRAAGAGLDTAEFAMGYFNEIGVYTPVNLEKAREWYEKAAKSGNKDAQNRIESLSVSRTLSKKDHEKVAISKIRSQFGSKKGQRPDRFKIAPTTMPTIADSGPPSPAGYSSNSPTGGRPPIRSSSTAPYPLEDNPPTAGDDQCKVNVSFPVQVPEDTVNPVDRVLSVLSGTRHPHWELSSLRDPIWVIPSNRTTEDIGCRNPQESQHGPALLPQGYERTSTAPPPGHPSRPSSARPDSRPPSRPSTGGRPPRHESMTPSQTPQPPPPSQSAPAQNAAQASSPANKPPPGPKTFDEMGVPTVKKDGDCVMM
ncbi:HCP-like protein [Saccharata proteae CBS 121410]|uniref:HCP-like protein n=1 Tax=Saccharata proteae CBS 121410 TaxID=1314787 RepID=A0A9P4HQ34_9PEZI|nr:HCP-like protein [Saccharata proteae CBS 121410]